MTRNIKAALLAGVTTILVGSGLASAQMEGPPPPDGPMQGLMHRQGRLADRMLAEFDLNHDGKITHTEFNTVIAKHYADVVHGRPGMTLDMYTAIGMQDFQRHTAEMFKRIDWKGDGKITFDEWAAPQRAHFEMMDQDGTGVISCAAGNGQQASFDPAGRRSFGRGGRGNSGGFGRAAFCRDNDLNQDGKVTRAEFDQSLARQFKAATKGAAAMTEAEFQADQMQHYRDTAARVFKRLDRDRAGSLSLAEFAAPLEKLFARLDRKGDGVLTRDELGPQGSRVAGSSGNNRRPRAR